MHAEELDFMHAFLVLSKVGTVRLETLSVQGGH